MTKLQMFLWGLSVGLLLYPLYKKIIDWIVNKIY